MVRGHGEVVRDVRGCRSLETGEKPTEVEGAEMSLDEDWILEAKGDIGQGRREDFDSAANLLHCDSDCLLSYNASSYLTVYPTS